MVDVFPQIVLSAFGSFIGHHQGLFACVKIFQPMKGLKTLGTISGISCTNSNVKKKKKKSGNLKGFY